MLPFFRSNTREYPLPDMQVSGGNDIGPGECASLQAPFFLFASEMGTMILESNSNR